MLQDVQFAPMVSCAGTACMEKKKKEILQLMLLNLYHVGVCLYFPILVSLKTSHRPRGSREMQKKKRGMQ